MLFKKANVFATRESVIESLAADAVFAQAVCASGESFALFESAFHERAPRQTDFLVTVMRESRKWFMPVGIAVQAIDGDKIRGREVRNTKAGITLDEITVCRREHVVDWRYIDTFECVGGALYKVALHRLPKMSAICLEEKQPFLLEWYDQSNGESIDFDPAFRDLCRDIANLRYEAVARTFKENRALFSKIGHAAKPDGAIRMRLVRRSAAHQAAAYGDTKMLRLFEEWGLLKADRDSEHLLDTAAEYGNLETTRALLEMSFNVDAPSGSGGGPLYWAVATGHEEVVALLVKHGADCARRDRGGRNILFEAKSSTIAAMLIDAGADIEVSDNDGRSCVQYHLQHGRADIAQLLVSRGARCDPSWVIGETEEQVRRRGASVLRRFFDDYNLMESIDFGYVLPIERLPRRVR